MAFWAEHPNTLQHCACILAAPFERACAEGAQTRNPDAAREAFDHSVVDADKTEVIAFAGELDVARKQELREGLRLAPQTRAVLIDLAAVSYADSTALSELLRFCLGAQRAAIAAAALVNAPQLERLIEYAGLTSAFKVFNDRDNAMKYLESSL